MMRNQRLLRMGGLGGPDLEVTIDRDRIAADNFACELLRQADGESRLARSCRSKNDDQQRIGPYRIIQFFARMAMRGTWVFRGD